MRTPNWKEQAIDVLTQHKIPFSNLRGWPGDRLCVSVGSRKLESAQRALGTAGFFVDVSWDDLVANLVIAPNPWARKLVARIVCSYLGEDLT